MTTLHSIFDYVMLHCAQNVIQVEAKTAELKQQYEEKLAMKEDLRKKAEFNEMMLQRASQLVDGLAGERERWLITVKASTLLLSSLGLSAHE